MPTVASAATANTGVTNTPPSGPGTEQMPQRIGHVHPGPEGGVGIGTGFSNTYGVGMEARLGWTFENGIYGGAAFQYFAGTSTGGNNRHATFVGGELGYKVFATPRLEIRPYVFLGPSFITQVSGPDGIFVDSNTNFAAQPSVMVMYHFGHAFVGGDGRWLVTPSPATFAVYASGGINF
jgi:hypothetical protein